jgi:hypothetical protein
MPSGNEMAFGWIGRRFPDASRFVDHRIDPAPGVQQISPETMRMVKYDLSNLLPERIYAG